MGYTGMMMVKVVKILTYSFLHSTKKSSIIILWKQGWNELAPEFLRIRESEISFTNYVVRNYYSK